MTSPGRRRSAPQMRLPLGRAPSLSRADFIAAPGNAEALAAIEAWSAWPAGRLALVGPQGSGKTHLARIWAAGARAHIVGEAIGEAGSIPPGSVLLEDADRRPADEALFHLLNRAESEGKLLLTARADPRDWPALLPDLRSRLNALTVVRLAAPDDDILAGLLRRFFRDRNIRPDEEVVSYLARRIERSVPAALDIVARIDEAADENSREITRALAREVLEAGPGSLDLFDEGCGTPRLGRKEAE